MRLYLYFFLSGIVVGFSICTLNCGLLLLPVVGDTSVNYKQGLIKGAIFSMGKVFSYSFYGWLASYSQYLLRSFIENRNFFIFGGVFLILYGIWFFIKEEKPCKKFNIQNIPVFLLGLIYGFLPCGPLIGFLFYVLYISKGMFFGVISGFLFGTGTVLGPILLCAFFPYIWKLLNRPGFRIYLRLLSSFIFIFWGINLLVVK